MTQAAAQFLGMINGALEGLPQGIGSDMHIRNIYASIQNALYHTEVTPEIAASAGHLRGLAQQFGTQFLGMIHGDRARGERDELIDRMRDAYNELRGLIEDAEPSAISRALGL